MADVSMRVGEGQISLIEQELQRQESALARAIKRRKNSMIDLHSSNVSTLTSKLKDLKEFMASTQGSVLRPGVQAQTGNSVSNSVLAIEM